ncbi:hypothetical protein AAVH_17780 [Aphelenchoides avenae]|nr:hypothetical protein AAVH_17780 [Aphelenchus avenae]
MDGRGCGGYGPPPPPTDDCRAPCHRTYGVPGQEECSCPNSTTASPVTCPACACSTCPLCEQCTTPAPIECTTPVPETTRPPVECTTPKPDVRCQPEFAEYQGRCWKLAQGSNLVAPDALQICKRENATLASIQNKEQNDFVLRLVSVGMNMTYNTNNGLWSPGIEWSHVRIGAINTGDRGWRWIGSVDKPLSYENWVDAALVPPATAQDTTGAILPDFAPNPGAWRAIPPRFPARKAVCVYDLQS